MEIDPDHTFSIFIEAMEENDLESAFLAINDLDSWYIRQGHPALFPNSDVPVSKEFVKNMFNLFTEHPDYPRF